MVGDSLPKGRCLRAHWIETLEIQDNYVLKGEELHHLLNVVRIEEGEALLLLNGKGLMVETRVAGIGKKALELNLVSSSTQERTYNFDLVLGMPKRDALELCLKQATELGFRNIFLVKSDYSQMRFPDEERTLKLLISALEQSNAPFLPKISSGDLKSIPWADYGQTLLLDSQMETVAGSTHSTASGDQVLIVGPEGGFSPEERKFLHSLSKVNVVKLPTPILRSPTALATGAGIMLGRLI